MNTIDHIVDTSWHLAPGGSWHRWIDGANKDAGKPKIKDSHNCPCIQPGSEDPTKRKEHKLGAGWIGAHVSTKSPTGHFDFGVTPTCNSCNGAGKNPKHVRFVSQAAVFSVVDLGKMTMAGHIFYLDDEKQKLKFKEFGPKGGFTVAIEDSTIALKGVLTIGSKAEHTYSDKDRFLTMLATAMIMAQQLLTVADHKPKIFNCKPPKYPSASSKKRKREGSSSSVIALQTYDGKYLSADWDGVVYADNRGEWEEFVMISEGSSVSLKTHHGKYLSADSDTGGLVYAGNCDAWEKF
jgi:hypothetical protein